MQNKWKFRFGFILCIIGIAILLTSLLIGRFIPGGFASLAIGFILISNSREK
ncbi:hypothetical protein [Methanobacterium oryzae]|uniref:hypothetical protein n=1 Tax=Methanobacterium oryzae TaxID=69540 RepID=UPI003D2302E9